MGTHRLATRSNEVIMKFFAVASALFVAASAEAQLPIASQYLASAGPYNGLGYGYAAPYAAAYAAPVAATAVDAKFAYGAPVTALNAGPLTAGPVAAAPAIAAPVVAAAPVAAPASSQYQAQDEFGNVAYGYQNINSAKQESGNALGGVTGSYTYADEAGVHTVNYVADALGFRVAGDNLPVAPVHAAVAPVNTLAPVVDTPEVVEAKAAFFQAYDAAKAGIVKRSAQIALPATYAAAPAIAATYAAAPLAATYAAAPAIAAAPAVAATYAAAPAIAAAPLAATYAAAPALAAAPVAATYAAAPAVAGAYAAAPSRDPVLTTIKLNPGHATFYRVD